MKKKYKLLFVVFIIVFVVLSLIFVNKKNANLVITRESESNKYLGISYDEGVTNNSCDRYYEDYADKIKVFSYDDVAEGFPIYIHNGCAVDLEYFLKNVEDNLKRTACEAQKNFVIDKKSITGRDNYNEHCLDIMGEDALEFTEYCETIKNNLTNSYAEYYKYKSEYESTCKTSFDPSKMVTNETSDKYPNDGCATKYINKYEETLLPSILITPDNRGDYHTCDWPVFYYKGQPWDWSILKKEDVDAKKLCTDYYIYLNENKKTSFYSDFNNNCVNSDILGEGYRLSGDAVPNTVKFSTVGGINSEGEFCKVLNRDYTNASLGAYSSESQTNSCVYKFNPKVGNVTIKSYDLPDTSNFVHQLNGTKFIGWKLSGNSCDSVLGKDENGNDIDIILKFTDYPQEIVLEPCFEIESENEYSISKIYTDCDGNSYGIEKTSDASGNLLDEELNYSKVDVKNMATLNSNIKTDYLYKSSSSTTEAIGKDMKFNINKYCSIKCTETVTYKYPTIFETVKSGTHFELLSYPEVTSIFTCTQNNNYDQWLKDYKEAIKKEAHAYITYKNIQNIENMMNEDVPGKASCKANECVYSKDTETGEITWGNEASCTGSFRGWGLGDTDRNGNRINLSWIGMSATNTYKHDQTKTDCSLDSQETKIQEALKNLDSIARNNLEPGEDWWPDNNYDYSKPLRDLEEIYINAKNDRKALEYSNKACANAMVEDANKLSNSGTSNKDGASYGFEVIDSDKFYTNYDEDNDIMTTSKFYYETSDEDNIKYFDGFDLGYSYEELDIIGGTVNDTGVHDWEKDTYEHGNAQSIRIYYLKDIKDETINDVTFTNNPTYNLNDESYEMGITQYNWGGSVDSSRLVYFSETFTPTKTAASFQRSIVRTLVFGPNPDNVYYSKFHSGYVNTTKDGIRLGYVYPVPLTFSGSRNVYFTLKYDSNLGYGAETILTSDSLGDSNKNKYICSYDVTNDIIVEDKTTLKKDDYKKNFYVRSIATNNVDPNDRYSSGTLGANWASDKGQALIDIIEKKSEGKNTYNPENLEYSFTLNAQTIETIREYNEMIGTYDNFGNEYYKCNDMGGECESEFLNGLSNGSLGTGLLVDNVNAIINRNTWKYYINGSWLMTKSINGSSDWINVEKNTAASKYTFNTCIDSSSAKATYECIENGVNEGVLP